SLLISIHGLVEGLGGGAIVGLDGITIGGGLGTGLVDWARFWTAFLVVWSADALRLSGMRSTVSVLERCCGGALTTPSSMSSSSRPRLIASASAKLESRRRSGARSKG